MASDGQGCKAGAYASLLTKLCHDGITHEEVLEKIAAVQEDLLQLQDETASANDLETFKRKRHQEHRLQFLLRRLERAEMRLLLSDYTTIFTTRLSSMESAMLSKIQELEKQVTVLSKKLRASEAVAGDAMDLAWSVESYIEETRDELEEVRQTAQNTAQQLKVLRKGVDAIDARARSNNAIVYGLKSTSPKEEVKSLLQGQQDLEVSVKDANYIGKKKRGDAPRPVLVKFAEEGQKDAFLRWSRDKQQLTATADVTPLRRTGMKRLAAVARELACKYPRIVVRRSYAQLGSERFWASDFAEEQIQIFETTFNISATIQSQEQQCNENIRRMRARVVH
jgi:hypothetical protein